MGTMASPSGEPAAGLAERLGDLGVLGEEDRQSVLRILDALIANTKVRSLARELEQGG